jgi:hypothetical protein
MSKSLQHKAVWSPKTILYLADHAELKSSLKKCAKDINYNFIDKKQSPLLLRDLFYHFIILDRKIMTEADWASFVNVSNYCDLGDDARHCLLILVNSGMTHIVPVLKRRPIVSLDIEDNSFTRIIIEHINARCEAGTCG